MSTTLARKPAHVPIPVTFQPIKQAAKPMERPLRVVSDYEPAGDQPTAIRELAAGVAQGDRDLVLLGVTGSGKTFTMAKLIEKEQRPTLILAPNKTLAAQLYAEMKGFFPDNAVEYFVSYYDYYQPEAYVPRTDTYIEKDSQINEQIERMRHSATRALLERGDVVIVASVSCIYGIGSVETYGNMIVRLEQGGRIERDTLARALVELQYRRNDAAFQRGTFRLRGETVDVFPSHLEDRAWRITLFGDEVESVREFDPLTGEITGRPQRDQHLRQQPLRDAKADAQPGSPRHQGRTETAAGPFRGRGSLARGGAAAAADHIRYGNDRNDRQLQVD